MLRPFEAKTTLDGRVVSLLPVGSKLNVGGLLARIRDASGTVQEFRAPVDGTISTLSAKEGEGITNGQSIAWLRPDRVTINDALRALAYVGTKDDLPLIESCAQDGSVEIAKQSSLTAKAIHARTGQ